LCWAKLPDTDPGGALLHNKNDDLAHAAPVPADRTMRGVLCLVFGIAIFSVQDLILKLLSDAYPVHEAMVIRSVSALPFLLFLVARTGGLRRLRTRNAPLLTLRGLILFSAYTSYYLGLAALPIALCVSLYFVGPLFTTTLSALFLRERIGAGRWTAVTLGFVGILIVLRPASDLFDPAALLPVYAGFAYAVTAVLARALRGDESAPVMAFYGNGVYLLGGLLLGGALAQAGLAGDEHRSLAFLLRAWAVPTGRDLLLLALCGAVAAFGTVLLTQAYRLAEASTVAPYEYTALVWSLLYGWLFWGEIPDAVSWVGMAIVIVSGIYALSSEKPEARRLKGGTRITN
jgi:drug/metabolite transporter (DMT)-like permease